MGEGVKAMLARPIQLADEVAKQCGAARCFRAECAELKSRADKLAALLRQRRRPTSTPRSLLLLLSESCRCLPSLPSPSLPALSGLKRRGRLGQISERARRWWWWEMEGRVSRRSVTLADQLVAVGPAPAVGPAGSGNLRDLLKLRDEDDLAAGRRAAVTLASAMAAEKRSSSPSPSTSAAARTLLDIIRDDQPSTSSAAAAAAAGANAGAGGPLVCRAVSLPAPQATSPPALTATEAAPPPPQAPQSQVPTDEEQGERVSLMALLEQTERQWSAGAGATVGEQELVAAQALGAEDEAEPEVGKGVAGGGCCCVCMARAKGAAFIPCGHTFCRTCVRELLAGRRQLPPRAPLIRRR